MRETRDLNERSYERALPCQKEGINSKLIRKDERSEKSESNGPYLVVMRLQLRLMK